MTDPVAAEPAKPKGGAFNFKWFVVGVLVMLCLRGGAQAYIEVNIERAKKGTTGAAEAIGKAIEVAPVGSETPEQKSAREQAEKVVQEQAAKDASEALSGGINTIVGYFVLVPFAYFLGALILGWKSPGRTILEPALAAIVVVVIATGYNVVRFGAEGGVLTASTICSSVGSFLVALIGGLIGEKIQNAAG